MSDHLHDWTTLTLFGQRACQTWNDVAAWERFFNTYPARSFLELGTWTGGFSLWLLLQCTQRDMEFKTIDTAPAPACDSPLGKKLGLAGHCVYADILANDGAAVLPIIASLPKPLVLFCDNGKKSQEFQQFTPHLAPGDFVAVHDWQTEFGEGDVDPVRGMLAHIDMDEGRTMTRWWRRV